MSNDHKIRITILFNGTPHQESFPANMKVREVMRKMLPAGEKDSVDKYQIIDTNLDKSKPLDPEKSLADNGVQDGHTLSMTKKDGGGGDDRHDRIFA